MPQQDKSDQDFSVMGKIQVNHHQDVAHIDATEAFEELLNNGELYPDEIKDTLFYIFHYFNWAISEGADYFVQDARFDYVCSNIWTLYEFASKLNIKKEEANE